MERFAFDFDPRFAPFLRAFGIRPDTAEVLLTDDDRFDARFGSFRLVTPIENIAGTERSGDYHWYKAIGARGSFADRGATFGTNTRAGLCVRFVEPVPALFGRRIPHPGLTVTVEDPAALEAAIEARRG